MRRTVIVLLAIVAAVLPAAAGAQSEERLSIGTAPDGVGALFLDGDLYAYPLASPQDFVVLDDGTVILADQLVGIVGIGGRFGADPENPELAARRVLIPNLPGAHRVAIGPDDDLFILTVDDGGVRVVEQPDGRLRVITDGLDTPLGLDFLPGGLVVQTTTGDVLVTDDGATAPAPEVPILGGIAPGPGGSVFFCDTAGNQILSLPGDGGDPTVVTSVPEPTVVVNQVGDGDPDDVTSLLIAGGVDDGFGPVFHHDLLTGVTTPLPPDLFEGDDDADLAELADTFVFDRALTTSTTTTTAPPPPAPVETTTTTTTTMAPPPAAATTTTAPSLVASDADEGGGIAWGLIGLLLLAVALAGSVVMTVRAYLDSKPPPGASPVEPLFGGHSVDMVPDDPCEELVRAAEAAEEAARAARNAADAAHEAARTATDAEAAAQDRLDAAAAELEEASRTPADGSWIEDDDGRITERDLELKRDASRAAWGAYQAGEIGAGELEQEWEELGEREAIDRLREADAARRAARRQAAEQEHAAATDQHREATEASRSSAAEAEEAGERAARAEAEAEERRRAADECLERTAAEYAEAERLRRAAAAERVRELEAEEERLAALGPVELETRVVPAPGSDRSHEICCDGATWVGFGGGYGGMSLFAGIESTTLHMVCADDPSKYVTMICQTLRLGLGLGGESNTIGAIVAALHASEVPEAVRGALNGVNWDVALGASAAKAAKTGSQVSQVKSLLKGLADRGAKPTKLSATDAAEIRAAGNVARSLTKAGAGRAVKAVRKPATAGTKQAAQAGEEGPTGLILPFGVGLQVGLWTGFRTKIWVIDFNSCGCVPELYSRG
ncbi:MAG: hypothetical protein R3290_01305 [Acidimicrobiia bacterium]|nr:hypothetical protein [Acidimicrobiia bacterium]